MPEIQPVESGEQLAGDPNNPVLQLLTAEFSDAALWQSNRALPAETLWTIGIRTVTAASSNEYTDDEDAFDVLLDEEPKVSELGVVVQGDEDHTWLAAAYGARLIQSDVPGEMILQTADLGVMCLLHERLRDTVLRGEHAHASRLVVPPTPQQVLDVAVSAGVDVVANNNTWLQTYAEGDSPVMAVQKDPDMSGANADDFDPHNWAYRHPFNNLFFPRELQDEIRAAAARAHRLRNMPESESPRYTQTLENMLRSGASVRNIAWGNFNTSYASRKPGVDYVDPVDSIDVVSDLPGYEDLLRYATSGESGTAQVSALRSELLRHASGITRIGPEDDALDNALTRAIELRQLLAPLVEFNVWYTEGRQASPQEVDQKMDDFFVGLARVADKLAGRYEYTPADTNDMDKIDTTPYWLRAAA